MTKLFSYRDDRSVSSIVECTICAVFMFDLATNMESWMSALRRKCGRLFPSGTPGFVACMAETRSPFLIGVRVGLLRPGYWHVLVAKRQVLIL